MSVRSKPNREGEAGEAPAEPERGENELPEGWAVAPVGDILNLVNGCPFKPSHWKQTGLPIIRIQNLNNPNAPFNYCTDEMPEKFRVRNGDLLFAWSGTPGTSFGAHIWEGGDAWLNQHIFRVEFDKQRFDRTFLKHSINRNLAEYIEQAHGGAGLAHITKGVFEKSLLPIAPLAEQRRIVGKLELLLGKVSSSQQRLSRVPVLLKRFRQSVLAAACSGKLTADWREENEDSELPPSLLKRLGETTSPDDLPSTWIECTIGDVMKLKNGYAFKSTDYEDSGIPLLRISNIQDDRVTLDGCVRLPAEKANWDFVVETGDILVAMSGATTGKFGVYSGSERCLQNPRVGNIRVLNDVEVCIGFRNIFLHSLRKQIEQAAYGGAQPNISPAKIEALPFNCPPLSEQQEIVRRVEKLFAFADQIESRLSQAQAHVDRLTQSVLAKAFRGELVPTEHALATAAGCDYESASELLARIRAERDNGAPEKPKANRRKRTPNAKSR